MSARRHTAATLRIQQRLDRLTLEHLRELAQEQAEEIEHLQIRAQNAEISADFWAESHHEVANELYKVSEGKLARGLTKSGQVVVAEAGGAA